MTHTSKTKVKGRKISTISVFGGNAPGISEWEEIL